MTKALHIVSDGPEHTSDCALHNAPAIAPGPCSCGASPLFKVFGYEVMTDTFKFTSHCRESLVADVAARALSLIYSSVKLVRVSTLIRRAVQDELTRIEANAISAAWARTVERDAQVCDRHGFRDTITSEDGSPLTEAQRRAISTEPGIGEIRTTLAPWFDFWGTLPELPRPPLGPAPEWIAT